MIDLRPTRPRTSLLLAMLLGAISLTAGPALAATVTRGPYLQMPAPSRILVRWRTDVATDSRVQLGAAPGALTQTVDDGVVTTEHVVALTGLSADTRYFYSVGSTSEVLAGDDADHFLRTSPTPGPARPMRIWVTGDGGFANANGRAVRDAYAAFASGSPTDFWLLLGDNAYWFGTDADYQAALFDMHHDMLRSVPTWPTFGNHEAFSSNSLTQTGPYFDMFSLPTAGEAGGVASGTEAYYSFDYANVHFIVLDSQSAATTAGSPMMLWLEADLQATSADWLVAFWHHPPYSKGLLHDSDVEVGEVNMRSRVLPVLEDYGVDLVLCGHSHSYERSFLLDGHYGLSSTFQASHQVDAGDGAPGGDGAYRKSSSGQVAHQGAVYVVAGSSSEVRTTTLNHPAMHVGLLELGSLVLDIDGETLNATFLNNLVQATDTFRITKGSGCPKAPSTGCQAGAKGRLLLRRAKDAARDTLSWTWRDGSLDAAQLGSLQDEVDLGMCIYDQTGKLVGGALPHGAAWMQTATGALVYDDRGGSHSGIRRVKLKPGTGPKASLRVVARGSAIGIPTLPATAPVTAQLHNLRNGACWQSAFTSASRSDGVVLSAVIP